MYVVDVIKCGLREGARTGWFVLANTDGSAIKFDTREAAQKAVGEFLAEHANEQLDVQIVDLEALE